ncbi:hypothetical protein [Sphingomonas sp.]|uniref:hypothetical protein n=1 Tax=Sphingomonas sp. TaxID=28214 RepID=UPI002E2F66F9|nr:hypothetical protein [Sphingomonas sp.]HEX4693101.1 hypothetical protein [Sphingomonas sp.]
MNDNSTTDTPEAGNMTRDPRQDAGQDRSIEKRLKQDPENEEAQLDRGLDESMDASDPPSAALPGTSGEPAKSSGYDEAAEAERSRGA